ncbi:MULTISPECIES: hypothetical protein [Rhizobium]|uniref:Uncharacterized protein n=1 Tax=Rhizobium grahamii TaxID=1120045 RepID=A0A370KRI4_9HYPH|nr:MULTISPECIES: hypothetical protein [Rhizobium]MCS3742004.1 hypothetical protein [Rhizobium sp. BK661]RDJ12409.1 hypothetical protein B5K06_11785 [Rhizobium grahamii]
MTVWIRIGLYIFAGWLASSGLIGDEVKGIITTDPAVADSINLAVSAVIAAGSVLWWKLAKRMGWKT